MGNDLSYRYTRLRGCRESIRNNATIDFTVNDLNIYFRRLSINSSVYFGNLLNALDSFKIDKVDCSKYVIQHDDSYYALVDYSISSGTLLILSYKLDRWHKAYMYQVSIPGILLGIKHKSIPAEVCNEYLKLIESQLPSSKPSYLKEVEKVTSLSDYGNMLGDDNTCLYSETEKPEWATSLSDSKFYEVFSISGDGTVLYISEVNKLDGIRYLSIKDSSLILSSSEFPVDVLEVDHLSLEDILDFRWYTKESPIFVVQHFSLKLESLTLSLSIRKSELRVIFRTDSLMQALDLAAMANGISSFEDYTPIILYKGYLFTLMLDKNTSFSSLSGKLSSQYDSEIAKLTISQIGENESCTSLSWAISKRLESEFSGDQQVADSNYITIDIYNSKEKIKNSLAKNNIGITDNEGVTVQEFLLSAIKKCFDTLIE